MALTVTEPGGNKLYSFWRWLTADGIGGGTYQATGNYSVTPLVLKVTCRAGEQLWLHKLQVHVQDAAQFDPAGYGGLVALTNGVTVGVFNEAGTEIHRLTQEPVTNLGEWAHFGESAYGEKSTSTMYFVGRLDLIGVSTPIQLSEGQSFRVTISDNMTGLDEHDFLLHGERRPA